MDCFHIAVCSVSLCNNCVAFIKVQHRCVKMVHFSGKSSFWTKSRWVVRMWDIWETRTRMENVKDRKLHVYSQFFLSISIKVQASQNEMNMIFWGIDIKSLHSPLRKLTLNWVLPKLTKLTTRGPSWWFGFTFRELFWCCVCTMRPQPRPIVCMKSTLEGCYTTECMQEKTKIWSRRQRASPSKLLITHCLEVFCIQRFRIQLPGDKIWLTTGRRRSLLLRLLHWIPVHVQGQLRHPWHLCFTARHYIIQLPEKDW